MPRRVRLFCLLALVTLPPVLAPISAQAHAILEASEPASGAVTVAGGTVLRFRFNSRIDHARSRLTLVRPDHRRDVLPIDPDTDAAVLTSHIDLTPGAYTVRWQVLAIDGHITRGDVPFTVQGR